MPLIGYKGCSRQLSREALEGSGNAAAPEPRGLVRVLTKNERAVHFVCVFPSRVDDGATS